MQPHAFLDAGEAQGSTLSCGALVFVVFGDVDKVALVETAFRVASTGGLTTYESLLTHLVQAESTDRGLRSIRYQMHAARFPIHRDLAGFDFDQSKVERRQIVVSFQRAATRLSK